MPIELPRKPYDRGRRDGRRGLVPISPWSPPAPTWTPLERQATWPGSAPAQQKGEGGPKDEEAAPENEGARLWRASRRRRTAVPSPGARSLTSDNCVGGSSTSVNPLSREHRRRDQGSGAAAGAARARRRGFPSSPTAIVDSGQSGVIGRGSPWVRSQRRC